MNEPERAGQPEKRCPDCRCALTQILIMDRGMTGLRYALPREKKAIIPTTSGTINGWVCPECQRVTLYAVPDKWASKLGGSAGK